MNARIDIKTPAGKSLEGFPFESTAPKDFLGEVIGDLFDSYNDGLFPNVTLHPGDVITIEIL